MEQNQERKFVCKYCNKRYPCGKSLGGHIRTHMNGNSAAAAAAESSSSSSSDDDEELQHKTKFKPNSKKKNLCRKPDSWVEGVGGPSGYGLRENPKKTKRFADSSRINGGGGLHQDIMMMICRECGKGFHSLKALCGHMACHSEKEKASYYNTNKYEDHDHHSGGSTQKVVVMDSQSDTETSAEAEPSRRRRRRRSNSNSNRGLRYNPNETHHSNSISLSSVVSGLEQEQEEVAKCLMMLSKDSTLMNKGFDFVAESSDNSCSEVLEAKSSSIDKGRNFTKSSLNKEKGKGKLKCIDDNSGMISSSDNSDSGYFRNGPKKVESDVSVDGYFRNVESNKVKVHFGSGFDGFNTKSSKNLSKFKSMTQFEKNWVNDRRDRRDGVQYDLRKTKTNTDPEIFCNKIDQKRSKYECSTCYRTFHSHRALGGHRASHNKNNNGFCSESMYNESGENSLVDAKKQTTHQKKLCGGGSSSKKLNSKKSKGHECPICFRMFKSGQALGGHKRSHFLGGNENSSIVVIKEDLSETPTLIDLNLPAPIDEETMENGEFMSW